MSTSRSDSSQKTSTSTTSTAYNQQVGASEGSIAVGGAGNTAHVTIQQVDADVVKKQLLVDLSLVFSPANTGKRLGWGPPADWQSTIDLLKQYRGLEGAQPATAYYTNEFLP